jgi:hypothetical protein
MDLELYERRAVPGLKSSSPGHCTWGIKQEQYDEVALSLSVTVDDRNGTLILPKVAPRCDESHVLE